MKRACEACGKSFDGATKNQRFCKRVECQRARARKRKQSQRGQVVGIRTEPKAVDLVGSVRAELERAGRLESVLGQQAVHLASQLGISGHTGSSVAAMHKELRSVMEAALATAERKSPVDELRQKRLERLGRGA